MSDDRPFPLSGRPPCLSVPDTLCLSTCEYGIVGQCARLPLADEDLANIGLSRACLNRIKAGGINTVQEAKQLGYRGLLFLPNVGHKYANEVWAAIGGPPATVSKTIRRVILESPYAGDKAANVDYARACLRDSLLRGEAPIASHLLYTQPGVLDDACPAEREQGIAAGLAWKVVAEASVVYIDKGITPGMQKGIQAAHEAGIPVETRRIRS